MNRQHAIRAMRERAPVPANPAGLFMLGAAITAGVVLLMQMPELRRYFRIRSM